jgi:hypothetical protein
MAFTFQPQNIVANPDVLFFKADTYEHREKLKTIFPYVLNAITPAVLAAQHELEGVRRDLARKLRELETIRNTSARWLAELQAWVLRARELGLIPSAESNTANDREQMIALLRAAVVKKEALTIPSPVAIEEAMQELIQLGREEQEVDGRLRAHRRRLAEMSKLKDNVESYQRAMGIQRDRLSIAKWLRSLQDLQRVCPLCEQTVTAGQETLDQFVEALSRIESDAARISSATSSFDRELVRVRRDIDLCVESLRAIGIRKGEVEARSGEAKSMSFRASEVARFVGRVEQGLEVHDSLSADNGLLNEVDELRSREEVLARTVAHADVQQRLTRALAKVALLASRSLPLLDTERPNDPLELSVTDLTIKVKGMQREDYLWEIGSGANWLSYHVVVSLALQQFFLDSNDAVPGFLVYDQPSQVYFPRRLARSEAEDLDPTLADEDVEAVRKVFSVLARVVTDAQKRLQIIVLDHAGQDVWKNVSNVHLVEEWRSGLKLVPEAWLHE